MVRFIGKIQYKVFKHEKLVKVYKNLKKPRAYDFNLNKSTLL